MSKQPRQFSYRSLNRMLACSVFYYNSHFLLFFKICISQGSVVMQSRYGGLFNNHVMPKFFTGFESERIFEVGRY